MTSPDPLADQLAASMRCTIGTRFRALVHGPSLDSDLAAGIRPSATAEHLARADRITRRRMRRRIASALRKAIVAALEPEPPFTPRAPINSAAIRASRNDLQELADAIVEAENPRVQGVAIAMRLAFDGVSPLFWQPDKPDAEERLANIIHAAKSALRVSGDFDREGEPVAGPLK
jgi:hypothetical protein